MTKKKTENKDNQIIVRVTTEDKRVLQKLADERGLTLSEYLRKRGLNKKIRLS